MATQGTRDDRFLIQKTRVSYVIEDVDRGQRTVAFNHERLNDIVANELKVGVPNPMADGGLGPGEKVVEDMNLVAQDHEAIDEMGADKASTTRHKDTLPLRRGKQFDGRETRKSGVGDSLVRGVIDRLGLIRGVRLALEESKVFLFRRLIARVSGGCDIMRAQVERAQDINRNFRVEPKLLGTDAVDLLSVAVHGKDF